ncbi:leucine-rich repeat protein 1-like [Triticum dicoccoides]|uniref:Leucine-rich repeat-containing N-terminal plant-type domain-containing protein n=1 Tax=Triticum turgidum subsp. durum TaxID=4567 RepID=A0A9R0UZH2_TRITD|nr:leucine-rich repeat protein 1-like [Triticum dicoccoides]VAH08680.1 unnamed protein product [Triticum turgidum subsp. durum]
MVPMAGGSLLALSVIVLAAVVSTLLLAPVAANDIDALSALKSGLKDPNGALKTWDPQLVDPCTWFHITCDDHKRVTCIDLGRQNLSGPLAPELGQLDRLQYLEVYGNRLSGPIPKELVGLSNLKDADFSNNDFCGPIPTSGPFRHIPRRSFANNPRLGKKC